MKRGREWIVYQRPVTALALEGHLTNVQVAVPDIADCDGPVCSAATFHSAEVRRACHGELARRRIPGHVDRVGICWIITRDGDRCRLRPEACRLEADRHLERIARLDRQRVGQDLWDEELTGRGRDTGYAQRAQPAVVQDQRFVLE